MKINSLSKKVLFALLSLSLIGLVFFAGLGFSGISSTKADTPTGTATLTVSAKNRDGEDYNGTNENPTFDSTPCVTLEWAHLSHFVITFAGDTNSILPQDNNKYAYKIEVGFLQRRANEGGNFDGEYSKIAEGEISDFNEINFNYYIDKTEDENKVSKNYGWGIYNFRITINNDALQKVSNFYFVKPSEIPSTEKIEIDVSKPSSDKKLGNKYVFTIKNSSYTYVDENLIRWYVKGKGYDGTNYALLQKDVGTTEFPDNDCSYLYTSLKCTGKSFEFDTDKGGTWSVYCVVYKVAPNEGNLTAANEITSTRDAMITFETGTPMATSIIIWIIVGVGVLLLGLIIFIIIRATKKEKVW